MTAPDLAAWRHAHGLTQLDLARLLGVTPFTISRWERGERAIPPYLHLALAALATGKRN